MIYLIRFFKWLWEKISSLWAKGQDEQWLENYEPSDDLVSNDDVWAETFKEPISIVLDESIIEPISWEEEHKSEALEPDIPEEPIISDVPPAVTIEEIKLPEPPKEAVHESNLKFEMPKLTFNLMGPVQGLNSASFVQVNQVGIQTKMGSTWIG